MDTQAGQRLHGAAAYGCPFFADAAGKYQAIQAAQDHIVRSDGLDQGVTEGVDGEAGAVIPVCFSRKQIAHIAAGARNSGHAALCVQYGIEFLRSGFTLFDEPEQHKGVKVSGAFCLRQAALRREAHGGIDGLPIAHGAHGRTAAEVTGYDTQRWCAGGKLGNTAADITMRRAVKAVMLDTICLSPGMGNGIDTRIVGHSGVKAGLPHSDEGYARHNLLKEAHSEYIGWIV